MSFVFKVRINKLVELANMMQFAVLCHIKNQLGHPKPPTGSGQFHSVKGRHSPGKCWWFVCTMKAQNDREAEYTFFSLFTPWSDLSCGGWCWWL